MHKISFGAGSARRLAGGLLALSLSASPLLAAPAVRVTQPGDLLGQWCGGTAQAPVRELWQQAGPDLWLGMSWTRRPGKPTAFEFLRIQRHGNSLQYVAQPGGRPPTVFAQKPAEQGWLRFDNPRHDFPQRIAYLRQGDSLQVGIAGKGRGGKTSHYAIPMKRCR